MRFFPLGLWLALMIAGGCYYFATLPPRIASTPNMPAREIPTAAPDSVVADGGATPAAATPATAAPVAAISTPSIGLPISGLRVADIQDTFEQSRGDTRKHEAADILAPTGTPVHAVVDGVVKKLFLSKPGGITLYQFDVPEEFSYYYAHLSSYAEGIVEGRFLKRGEVLGYVGSTGNADPKTPHLHFAMFALKPDKKWWQGDVVNPYPLLVRALRAELGL